MAQTLSDSALNKLTPEEQKAYYTLMIRAGVVPIPPPPAAPYYAPKNALGSFYIVGDPKTPETITARNKAIYDAQLRAAAQNYKPLGLFPTTFQRPALSAPAATVYDSAVIRYDVPGPGGFIEGKGDPNEVAKWAEKNGYVLKNIGGKNYELKQDSWNLFKDFGLRQTDAPFWPPYKPYNFRSY